MFQTADADAKNTQRVYGKTTPGDSSLVASRNVDIFGADFDDDAFDESAVSIETMVTHLSRFTGITALAIAMAIAGTFILQKL